MRQSLAHTAHTAARVPQNLRAELFSSILKQPTEFFDDAEVGVLTSRLGNDCQVLAQHLILSHDASVCRCICWKGSVCCTALLSACTLQRCTSRGLASCGTQVVVKCVSTNINMALRNSLQCIGGAATACVTSPLSSLAPMSCRSYTNSEATNFHAPTCMAHGPALMTKTTLLGSSSAPALLTPLQGN